MKYKHYFVHFLLVTLFASCKQFLDIPSPIDSVISSQAFSNDNKATSVITSIYGYMINGSPSFTNFMATKYGGLSAGELDEYNPSPLDQEFINNALTPGNPWVEAFWSTGYKDIYYANAAIAGINSSDNLSHSVHNQLLGEAKFIRAFCYFYLTNYFGGVPLVTTTDYVKNMNAARSSSQEVYKQIVADLVDATGLLSENYPTGTPTRPNKYTVESLLARAYLYLGNWKDADSIATDIINSQDYVLLDSLNQVFLAGSKEAIWQLTPSPANGIVPELLNVSLPYSAEAGPPRCIISNDILQSFEPGDKRKTAWIDSLSYFGKEYYYSSKYHSLTFTNEEYYTVFRYAEIYLIRAEARCHENDITGSPKDLNKIRNRAGLINITVTDPASILNAIMHERKIELFSEWGHRWFDLKRTGRIDTIMRAKENDWQPFKKLYPIPSSQLEVNKNLVQNKGY